MHDIVHTAEKNSYLNKKWRRSYLISCWAAVAIVMIFSKPAESAEQPFLTDEKYAADLFQTMCLNQVTNKDQFEALWKEKKFDTKYLEAKTTENFETNRIESFYYHLISKENRLFVFSAKIDVETNVRTYCGLSLQTVADFNQTMTELTKLLKLQNPIYSDVRVDQFSVITDESGNSFPRSEIEATWEVEDNNLFGVEGNLQFYNGISIGSIFLQSVPKSGV